MKKLGFVGAAFAVAVGVLGVVAPQAHAVAAATTSTCSWSATAADTKFNNAVNWTCTGGVTVPDTTTAVTMDSAAVYASVNVGVTTPVTSVSFTNDLPSAVGSFTVDNTDATKSIYITIDKLGLVDNGSLIKKANTDILVSVVTSLGSITVKNVAPAWSIVSVGSYDVAGIIDVAAQNATVNYQSQSPMIKNAKGIILDEGAILNVYGDAAKVTLPFDVTVNKGSLNVYEICNQWDQTTQACKEYVISNVVFSGTVTLNSDTKIVVGKKGIVSVDITKAIAGTGKLVFEDYSEGTLKIAGVEQAYPIKAIDLTGVKDCKSDRNAYTVVSRNTTGTLKDATYTGGQVIVDGTLKGNGTFVHCDYGSGSVWGGDLWVNEGAYIAPGNSPGLITADQFNLDGIYQFQFGGDDPGTGYDQIVVTNFYDTAKWTDPHVVTLGATAKLDVSQLGTYIPAKDKVFTIIDNKSKWSVKGTFSGLVEGATFAVNGFVFKISYVGGDGNDVTLTALQVPKAPNTGFEIVKANPTVVAAATILAVGVLFGIGRRLQATRK